VIHYRKPLKTLQILAKNYTKFIREREMEILIIVAVIIITFVVIPKIKKRFGKSGKKK
jgi:hypothetical protein